MEQYYRHFRNKKIYRFVAAEQKFPGENPKSAIGIIIWSNDYFLQLADMIKVQNG